MNYEVIKRIPNLAEYLLIRSRTGLADKDPTSAAIGLENTLFSICIEQLDQPGVAIGMGRIIGDGGIAVQIMDIAVLPEHQKKGLGDLIMHELVSHIQQNLHPSVYVTLFAENNLTPFYKRYGFEPQTSNLVGMLMKQMT